VDDVAEGQRASGAAPPGYFALKTKAYGNCLPRSLSSAVFGTDQHHVELRVRIACELATHKERYLSSEVISNGTSLNDLNSMNFYWNTGDFF
jgi:hypothetical protein